MSFEGIAIWSDITFITFNNPYFAASYEHIIVVFGTVNSQYVPLYKETAKQKIISIRWDGPSLYYCVQDNPEIKLLIPSDKWNISKKTIFANTALVFPKLSGKAIPEKFINIQGVLFNNLVLDEIPFGVERSGDSIQKSNTAPFTFNMGTWLPEDFRDFDSLKTRIRSWAREACIEEFPSTQISTIKEMLSMVLLDCNKLPDEGKLSLLLLNSLIAHHLYTKVISIIFGEGNEKDKTQRPMLSSVLLPEDIRNSIAGTVQNFLSSPVKILLRKEIDKDRLESIYNEAADISSGLRARNITLKCSSLHDLPDKKFNANSSYLEAYATIHPDDHEDQLLGKPITMVVHPLLQAYVEQEKIDNERVLSRAVVWFRK